MIHSGGWSFLGGAFLARATAGEPDGGSIERSFDEMLALQLDNRFGGDHGLGPLRPNASQMKSEYPFGHCSCSPAPAKKAIPDSGRGILCLPHRVHQPF
jgi:hypothetical protein